MIQFQCTCGQTMAANEHDAGKATMCPKCNARITIPASSSIQSGAPASPPSAPPGAVREGQAPERPHRDDDDDQPRRRRREEVGRSGKAVAALILGLLSFCLPGLLSLPAIIFGFLGLSDTRKGKSGGGMAIAGLVMGFLSMFAVLPLAIIIALLFPAMQRVRDASARIQSTNNIKQMTLAMHSHNDAYRKLPQHAIYSKDGKPLLSWRVAILPFIEQDNLYRQFRLDEPWDSPNNRPLLNMMPKVYAHPAAEKGATANGLTHYQVFVGEQGQRNNPVFVKGASFVNKIQNISAQDGTANTIFVIESANPVPWTKPEDIPYSPARPLPKFGLLSTFMAGMADGSVRGITRGVSDQTMRNAITYNDGKALGPDW